MYKVISIFSNGVWKKLYWSRDFSRLCTCFWWRLVIKTTNWRADELPVQTAGGRKVMNFWTAIYLADSHSTTLYKHNRHTTFRYQFCRTLLTHPLPPIFSVGCHLIFPFRKTHLFYPIRSLCTHVIPAVDLVWHLHFCAVLCVGWRCALCEVSRQQYISSFGGLQMSHRRDLNVSRRLTRMLKASELPNDPFGSK